MDTLYPSTIPDTQPAGSSLDADISRVRQQILKLTHRRASLTAAVLSSPSSQILVDHAKAKPAPSPHLSSLEKRIRQQRRDNEQNIYRMCAGVTMFEAKDPDPHAVDGGRITGVRIEVSDQLTRKFRPPYYLLLNRPNPASASLRIHRHTIPPCIPLPLLAAKYLPPCLNTSEKPAKQQNLTRLVRELRREIVSYFRRQDAVSKLAKETKGAKSIMAVDAEIRDVRAEWQDGTACRLAIEKGGEIHNVVVVGEDGKRKRAFERSLLGAGRLENISLTRS